MTGSAAIALLMLNRVLVALPRAGALASLGRLRSPAWAAILPGAICPRIRPRPRPQGPVYL